MRSMDAMHHLSSAHHLSPSLPHHENISEPILKTLLLLRLALCSLHGSTSMSADTVRASNREYKLQCWLISYVSAYGSDIAGSGSVALLA